VKPSFLAGMIYPQISESPIFFHGLSLNHGKIRNIFILNYCAFEMSFLEQN